MNRRFGRLPRLRNISLVFASRASRERKRDLIRWWYLRPQSKFDLGKDGQKLHARLSN